MYSVDLFPGRSKVCVVKKKNADSDSVDLEKAWDEFPVISLRG